jgi:transposase
MKLTTIGLDLAKNVFQVHGVDEHGKKALGKALKRPQVPAFFANLPPCVVGMEACGGAHDWARELEKLGHTPRLVAPQFVKPYVKGNKNDANDAEAICEAVGRPNMRFVAVKTPGQQDLQALHRVRERRVADRTAKVNQARGLLAECGIAIGKGIGQARQRLPEILDDAGNGLSDAARAVRELHGEIVRLDGQIAGCDRKAGLAAKASAPCQRLMQVAGIGPPVAAALAAAAGDGRPFEDGRQLAAWLGLVPRQDSSGGKPRMLGHSQTRPDPVAGAADPRRAQRRAGRRAQGRPPRPLDQRPRAAAQQEHRGGRGRQQERPRRPGLADAGRRLPARRLIP